MVPVISTIFTNTREFCSTGRKNLFSSYDRRIVEIGFGNGDFLVHLAEKHGPGTLILGLEVSAVCALKATRRLSERHLTNARIILGDARFLLEKCFPDESLCDVFMNFPCPWPKTRHASRRVTSGRFAGTLSRVLERQGKFSLVTDEGWYAREVNNSFLQDPSFELVSFDHDPDLEITTKYGSKWREMGKTIFRLTVRKKGKYSGFPLEKVEEIETMHTRIALADIETGRRKAADLLSGTGTKGPCHWSFKAIYWSDDGHALVKTITSDDGFEQTFFFRLVFTGGSLLVKVEDAGAPLHTEAVKLAMASIAAHFREAL